MSLAMEALKAHVKGGRLIRDWRNPDEWPTGAKPVTRKIQYDDLYRVTRVDYQYAAGDDTWTSPFKAEVDGEPNQQDRRRAQPSPHVSFERRTLWQTFQYDWLGNTSRTDDDAHGFYDRSLGTITNDIASDKPYQLRSAMGSDGMRSGQLEARYDDAGNLTRLDVRRNNRGNSGSQAQQLLNTTRIPELLCTHHTRRGRPTLRLQ